MAYSVQQFTSTGTEDHVILSFPYLDKADIHLYGDSVESAFIWVSSTRIDFPPFPAGVEVVVRRLTNRGRVRYLLQEGAPFTREILDQIHTQSLYLAQEAAEGVFFDMYGDIDMHGFRVRNAGSPELPKDYTTKEWVESAIRSVNDDYGLRSVFTGPDGRGLDDYFGGGGWLGADAMNGSIYNTAGAVYTNASRMRYALTEDEVTKDPTIWLNKRTALSRDDGVNRWDSGNLYAALDKVAGSAYGASITGVARHLGGSGDMIGLHGRGYGYHGDSKVWGGWLYASSRPNPDGSPSTDNVVDLIGLEINLNNSRGDVSYTPAAGKGVYRGLVVNTADGSRNAHIGVDIGAQTGSNSQPWYVGVRVRSRGIMPFDAPEGDRAVGVLVEGSNALSTRYGGIALRGAAFHYGLDMSEVVTIDNNAAIVLKDGHQIKWGSRTSSRHLSANSTTGLLNANNYNFAINGVKVLGARKTGIFQLSGTGDPTSKSTETVTLVELARYVKAISDALIDHGLYGPT